MNIDQIKDLLFSCLLRQPGSWISSQKVAQELNLDEKDLMHAVDLINGQYTNAIRTNQGYGNDLANLMISPAFKPQAVLIMEKGGFVGMVQVEETEKVDLLEIRALYKENLKLSNDAAHEARLSADKSESRALHIHAGPYFCPMSNI